MRESQIRDKQQGKSWKINVRESSSVVTVREEKTRLNPQITKTK